MDEEGKRKLRMERDLLKQKRRPTSRGAHVKLGFTAQHRGAWPVTTLCKTLGVSRSGFHTCLNGPRSRRSHLDERLASQVRQSFVVSDPHIQCPTRLERRQATGTARTPYAAAATTRCRHATVSNVIPIDFEKTQEAKVGAHGPGRSPLCSYCERHQQPNERGKNGNGTGSRPTH